MLHVLRATPKTVHWGYFDAALAPALTVDSGDLVQIEAVTHHAGDAPDLLMDKDIRQLFLDVPEADRNPGVHIMTGPIYVEGARPGDMLEVRYLEMTPRFLYGSNLAANWGYLYKELGEKDRVTIYAIDPVNNLAEALYAYDYPEKYLTPGKIVDPAKCCRETALDGFRIPTRPHLGTAGVAPDVKGRVSTVPPGAHGGNIDDVLPGTGRWRTVLGRRSAYLAGRWRTERYRDRSLAQCSDADYRAQGFHLSVPLARDPERMDRSWFR
jgi:acetamidase/formamidase